MKGMFMYFPCIILYKNASEEYYPEGVITINGDVLLTSSMRVASLCQDVFDNQNANFKNNPLKQPKEFINFLNRRFGNQYFAIYSEEDLQDKNVQPANNYSDNIIATFDLDSWSYKFM